MEYKKILESLKDENRLKDEVIGYVLEYYKTNEEIKMFFEDLLRSGCQSGIIGSLIYYKDTNDFFDKYEEEIEDLISKNMEMLGIETRPLFIESLNGSAENMTQEKNLLSWFAFEEIAREISENNLKIEMNT